MIWGHMVGFIWNSTQPVPHIIIYILKLVVGIVKFSIIIGC